MNTAEKLGVVKQDLYSLIEFLVEQNISSLSPEINGLLISLSIKLGQIRIEDIPKEIEDELFAYIKAVDMVAKTNTIFLVRERLIDERRT